MDVEDNFKKLLIILNDFYYNNKSKYKQQEVKYNIENDLVVNSNESEINDIINYLLSKNLSLQFITNDNIFFKIKLEQNFKILFIIKTNSDYELFHDRKLKYIFSSNLRFANNFLLPIMNFDIPKDSKYSNQILDYLQNNPKIDKNINIDLVEYTYNGILFDSYLSKNINNNEIILIIFKICYIIKQLQDIYPNIRINNLNTKNILILFLPEKKFISYKIDDKIFNFNTNIIVKIIDLSKTNIPNIFEHKYLDNNLKNNDNLFDIKTILTNILKFNLNDNLKDFINILLKTDNINDMFVNNFYKYFSNNKEILKGGYKKKNIINIFSNYIEMSSENNSKTNSDFFTNFNEDNFGNLSIENESIKSNSKNELSDISKSFIKENSISSDIFSDSNKLSEKSNHKISDKPKKIKNNSDSIKLSSDILKNNSESNKSDSSFKLSSKSKIESETFNLSINENSDISILSGGNSSNKKISSIRYLNNNTDELPKKNKIKQNYESANKGNTGHKLANLFEVNANELKNNNNRFSQPNINELKYNAARSNLMGNNNSSFNQSIPQAYGNLERIDPMQQEMDQMPPGMNQMPQGMDNLPYGMDHIQPRMDQMPPSMNQMPPGMERYTPIPPGMENFHGMNQGMPYGMGGMQQNMSGMDINQTLGNMNDKYVQMGNNTMQNNQMHGGYRQPPFFFFEK